MKKPFTKSLGKRIYGKRVYAIGDVCLDVLCSVKERAALGEEKSLNDLTFSLGGNAANFSFAAKKLGFNVQLFSAIGKDFATDFLKQKLAKASVKANLKQFQVQNAFSIILVGKSGQRAIYSTKGALEKLSAEDVEKQLLPKLSKKDLVFFGGYFHMRGLHNGFLELLKKIKSKGAFVAFDLCFDTQNKWKILDFLPFIDLLLLNNLELKHLTKKKSEKDSIKFLFSKGATMVALKKGAGGSAFFSEDFSASESAFKIKEIDTTAAGDIFNAAFLKAFLSGKSPKKALLFANFVASEKIKRHGLFVPAKNVLYKKLQ